MEPQATEISPLAFELDAARRFVRILYHSQPTFEQWSTFVRFIFDVPGFETGFGVLLDRRAIPRGASTSYIRSMTRFIDTEGAARGISGWAILVVGLESFGMGRMAQGLCSSEVISVFTKLEDAEAWLAKKAQAAA